MTKFVSRFLKDESGATAIEYGLIVALIAVVIIGAVTTLGKNLSTRLHLGQQQDRGFVSLGPKPTFTETGGRGAIRGPSAVCPLTIASRPRAWWFAYRAGAYMSAFLRRFISDETGASAITYGLILALFAVAIITAVQLLDIRLKAGLAHAKPH